jgi:hypothetical protein
MVEDKPGKDNTGDTCNESSPILQQEQEGQSHGSLYCRLSKIKHRSRSCTIPEWMQRWALGE